MAHRKHAEGAGGFVLEITEDATPPAATGAGVPVEQLVAPPATNLSVVIPAFNEALRLPHTLDRLGSELDGICGPDWEIVVCDDGSSDGTAATVERYVSTDGRIRLVRNPVNAGKGASLARGFAHSTGTWVLMLDADLPVPTSAIADALATAQERRADVVVGSRRLAASTMAAPQPLVRRAGGSAFLWCVDRLGLGGHSDPQCGFKLFRRERVAAVVSTTTVFRFGFDIELLLRCDRAGLDVVEIPVDWTHVDGSTLRPVRDAAATIVDLRRLRRVLRAEDRSLVGPVTLTSGARTQRL